MIKKKQKNSKELLFENMAKLNPDFIYLDSTNLKKLVNESEDKWIQKATLSNFFVFSLSFNLFILYFINLLDLTSFICFS